MTTGRLPENIQLTRLSQPVDGCAIIRHCPICNVHEIAWSPYAIKPEDGDCWMFHIECPLCFTWPRTFMLNVPLAEENSPFVSRVGKAMLKPNEIP